MQARDLTANPLTFSSEVSDFTLGLQYYNYRHLNMLDGRWVNRDPIEEEGGMNVYGACNNDFYNILDFLGSEVAKIERKYIGFRAASSGVYYSYQWNITATDCKTKETVKEQMGPIFFKHVDTGDGNYFNPWNLGRMGGDYYSVGFKVATVSEVMDRFECSEGSLVIHMEYSTEQAEWKTPEKPIENGDWNDEAWHDRLEHTQMKKDGKPAIGKLNIKKGGTVTLTYKWHCCDKKLPDETNAVYTIGDSTKQINMEMGNPRPGICDHN